MIEARGREVDKVHACTRGACVRGAREGEGFATSKDTGEESCCGCDDASCKDAMTPCRVYVRRWLRCWWLSRTESILRSLYVACN